MLQINILKLLKSGSLYYREKKLNIEQIVPVL